MKTNRIPIALQLWSIREDIAADLPGALRQLAEMGYEGVELAGFNNVAPKKWAELLKANGLGVAGAHIGLDALAADKFNETADMYAEIGCTRLTVPALAGKYTGSLDGYRRACAAINAAAERAKARGFTVGYHNHDFEFRFVENRVPFFLMADCLTSDVYFQLDMGWMYKAGVDGAKFVRDFPGRCSSIHVKSYSKENPKAVVGDKADVVPWTNVFEACESVGGTQWYVVEHEEYADPPMECVRQCLDNLRAMGKTKA